MDRGVAFDLLNEPLPVVFTVAPNFLPNLLADLLDGAAIRGDGLRTLVGQRICGGLQAHWFGQLKELTIWGYFTSEIVVTQVLHESPLGPGRYEGCVPLAAHPESPSS